MGFAREPSIVVISGAQGAGKSTVAALLASRCERSALINAGAVQKFIVGGLEWPASESEAGGEFARQLRLRLHAACALARVFVDGGFTAFIEDQVVGERVEHLLEDMDGDPFRFVMLAPRQEAIVGRERGRGTNLYERWGSWEDEIRTRTRRVGLWLDTSDQTPDETVAEIVARWDDALVGAG